MRNDIERFTEKWEFSTISDCWIWIATPSSRYGIFWLNSKNEYAHRAAWMLYKGEIPCDKWVLHHCDVAGCVNPDHLYIGDHAQNTKDAVNRKRMMCGDKHRAAHKGKHKTANDGQGFLSDKVCIGLKKEATKHNKQELADKYGVHITTIYRGICKANILIEGYEENDDEK